MGHIWSVRLSDTTEAFTNCSWISCWAKFQSFSLRSSERHVFSRKDEKANLSCKTTGICISLIPLSTEKTTAPHAGQGLVAQEKTELLLQSIPAGKQCYSFPGEVGELSQAAITGANSESIDFFSKYSIWLLQFSSDRLLKIWSWSTNMLQSRLWKEYGWNSWTKMVN